MNDVMNGMAGKRKVVLGLGSTLCQDDGVGLHLLQAMQATCGGAESVEWIDGGVLGLDLLPLVEECSHLLVLDAIDASQPAGTILEMSGDQIPLFQDVKLSEHQVGFQEVLAVACLRGNLPAAFHLVGVQPTDLTLGLGLTRAVTAAVPAAAGRALVILRDWQLLGVDCSSDISRLNESWLLMQLLATLASEVVARH